MSTSLSFLQDNLADQLFKQHSYTNLEVKSASTLSLGEIGKIEFTAHTGAFDQSYMLNFGPYQYVVTIPSRSGSNLIVIINKQLSLNLYYIMALN